MCFLATEKHQGWGGSSVSKAFAMQTEDWSLIHRTQMKKSGVATHSILFSGGRDGGGGTWGLLADQPKLAHSVHSSQ